MEPDIRLNQRQQDRFERLFAEVEAAVSSFDNSEHAERLLIDTLHKLEVWMQKAFGTPPKEDRDRREEKIVHAAGRPVASIASLLTAAQANVDRLLRATNSPEEVARQMRIVHQQAEGILLPPGNGQIKPGDGSGIEPPRVEPRLQWLVAALPRVGVYTDDLIMTTGAVCDQMMRKVSYALLEIPKIRKEVLVCNQVGEATFVSARMLGMAAYQRHTKEELEALPGVTRVVCRTQDQWTEEVLALLQSQKVPTKINVRDIQEMRREILARYPTAQEWVSMTANTKKKIKVYGKGLRGITRIFNIEGDPISNHSIHLRLGAAIYGEDDPVICKAREQQIWTLEQWRAEVKKAIPNAALWIEMTGVERRQQKFGVSGQIGIVALARIFGIQGNPTANHSIHLLLGKAIYGEGDLVIGQKLEQTQWTTEDWRKEVIKSVPDVATWTTMSQQEKLALKINQIGLVMLAQIFGIAGKPIHNHGIHLRLGAAIYGADDPVIRQAIAERESSKQAALEQKTWTMEEWRAEVKKQVPDSVQWTGMATTDKQKFYIGKQQIGLMALARVFGIEGNPVGNRSVHLQLGTAIYGADDPVIQQAIALQEAKQQIRDMMDADDVE